MYLIWSWNKFLPHSCSFHDKWMEVEFAWCMSRLSGNMREIRSFWSHTANIRLGGRGGWSPTGSTRHVSHQLAYCTSPGWLWGWRIWWNDDWQGKLKYSEKTRHGGKPATNRLSYGTACSHTANKYAFMHMALKHCNSHKEI
jgi:hypothetical protein